MKKLVCSSHPQLSRVETCVEGDDMDSDGIPESLPSAIAPNLDLSDFQFVPDLQHPISQLAQDMRSLNGM